MTGTAVSTGMSLEKMSSTLQGPVTSGVLPVNAATTLKGLVHGESRESTSEAVADPHPNEDVNSPQMSTFPTANHVRA